MTQHYEDYARTYSAMADEEIKELFFESSSLVGDARQALQQEIERRGLKPELLQPAPLEPTKIDRGPTCPGCGRIVTDPLTCGSCATTICRVCGTPLELEWSGDGEPGDEEESDAARASSQAAGE
jgi:hypothetical protein